MWRGVRGGKVRRTVLVYKMNKTFEIKINKYVEIEMYGVNKLING